MNDKGYIKLGGWTGRIHKMTVIDDPEGVTVLHQATIDSPNTMLLVRCLYQRVYQNWMMYHWSWEKRIQVPDGKAVWTYKVLYRQLGQVPWTEDQYPKASAADRLDLIRLGLVPSQWPIVGKCQE